MTAEPRNPDQPNSDTTQLKSRRAFMKTTGLTALGAMLGMAVPFERNLLPGIIPVALAQDTGMDLMAAKKGRKKLKKNQISLILLSVAFSLPAYV